MSQSDVTYLSLQPPPLRHPHTLSVILGNWEEKNPGNQEEIQFGGKEKKIIHFFLQRNDQNNVRGLYRAYTGGLHPRPVYILT